VKLCHELGLTTCRVSIPGSHCPDWRRRQR
jgi:hypothetical protein